MSGRSSRPQGRRGLLKLQELAADLISGSPDDDYAGWDVSLEEDVDPEATPFVLVNGPAYFRYFVQVKTVKRDSENHRRKRESYLLDHCVRASKDLCPWFMFIAVEDKRKITEAFLVHLGDKFIRRTASTLLRRRKPKALWIKWSERDRVSPLEPDALLALFHRHRGTDPHTYSVHKQTVWGEYASSKLREEPHRTEQAHVTSAPGEQSQAEPSIDLQLDMKMSYSGDKPTTVDFAMFRKLSSRAKGTRTSGRASFRSAPIWAELDPVHRLIIGAPGFRLSMPFPGTQGQPDLIINLSDSSGLGALVAAMSIEALWNRAARRGGRLELEVDFEGGSVSFYAYVMRRMVVPPWRQAAYRAYQDLYRIQEYFGLTFAPSCDILTLLSQGSALSTMANVLGNPEALRFRGETRFDSTEMSEFSNYTPFVACIQIGELRAVVAGIIVRDFKRLSSHDFEWTSRDWRVVHKYAGLGQELDDELPDYVAKATAALAELECCLAHMPIAELDGFVMKKWPAVTRLGDKALRHSGS